jgi:hypothetical protein
VVNSWETFELLEPEHAEKQRTMSNNLKNAFFFIICENTSITILTN